MATRIDQKDFVKTALRLPPDLHAGVHASAQLTGRSYNAELVDLIRKGLAYGMRDDIDRMREHGFAMKTRIAEAEHLEELVSFRMAQLEERLRHAARSIELLTSAGQPVEKEQQTIEKTKKSIATGNERLAEVVKAKEAMKKEFEDFTQPLKDWLDSPAETPMPRLKKGAGKGDTSQQ